MEYLELIEHEARAANCAEATLPGETLRRIIQATLNPFCWCVNCKEPTEHDRRGYDLCCNKCDFIALTFHERPNHAY